MSESPKHKQVGTLSQSLVLREMLYVISIKIESACIVFLTYLVLWYGTPARVYA